MNEGVRTWILESRCLDVKTDLKKPGVGCLQPTAGWFIVSGLFSSNDSIFTSQFEGTLHVPAHPSECGCWDLGSVPVLCTWEMLLEPWGAQLCFHKARAAEVPLTGLLRAVLKNLPLQFLRNF